MKSYSPAHRLVVLIGGVNILKASGPASTNG